MTDGVAQHSEHLAALTEIDALLQQHRVLYWLFGGWAVDFHAGRVTRDHSDIDLAIWLKDRATFAALLRERGWLHRPEAGEDGNTCYERDAIRLEVAFLVRDECGQIFTPLHDGRGEWPAQSFGTEVAHLGGVRARVVSRESLIADKSIVRSEPATAAKDRADIATLLHPVSASEPRPNER